MKISELLKNGIYVLKEKNIDESGLKARLLLAHLLAKPKEYIITHDKEEISLEKQKEYYSYLDRLILGEPLQYITNSQEFMGLKFYVDKNVLIPQPDTEILAEAVYKYVWHNCGKTNVKFFENVYNPNLLNPNILDLCTGSGAIAVYLSKKIEEANVYASDISRNAIEVAKINAKNHNAKVEFIESDLFENINDKFDIIVSNPPYIKTDIISTLSKEVQNEPYLALDGGKDGLDFYRKIIKESKKYLNKNGGLFLEIGYDQKKEVKSILEKENYKNIITLKDFSENDRVVIGFI